VAPCPVAKRLRGLGPKRGLGESVGGLAARRPGGQCLHLKEPGLIIRSGGFIHKEPPGTPQVSVSRPWHLPGLEKRGRRPVARAVHPPVRGLSAGSLREPPRRISRAGTARWNNAARGTGSGAGRWNGAGDAPWSGRAAPARSAPVCHPTAGRPEFYFTEPTSTLS
jgi:hypothetical protein